MKTNRFYGPPSWTDDPVKDAERWEEYLEECNERRREEDEVEIFQDEEERRLDEWRCQY